MNIASRIKEYYKSEDFKSNYLDCLSKLFNDSESDIINSIIKLFNVSNYETENCLKNHRIIEREQAKKIYDFITENLEDFTADFNGYYVGYTSLQTISFGEQEEQLEGLYNRRTGKDYSLKYLKQVFSQEDFFINGAFAYYDISDSGLHIDLLNNVNLLDNFLLEL